MTDRIRIRLPEQWSKHVESGVLRAISSASVVVTHARARALGRRRLQIQLRQAEDEIELLRAEHTVEDVRTRRRPRYTPTQRTTYAESMVIQDRSSYMAC